MAADREAARAARRSRMVARSRSRGGIVAGAAVLGILGGLVLVAGLALAGIETGIALGLVLGMAALSAVAGGALMRGLAAGDGALAFLGAVWFTVEVLGGIVLSVLGGLLAGLLALATCSGS